jgi:hypothetical protein
MLSKELTDQLINNQKFGFLLVRQKEYILDLINKRKYSEARACLTALCELWTIAHYKYKYEELIKRLKDNPIDYYNDSKIST